MARKRDSVVSSLAGDTEITSNNLEIASTIQDSPHNLARAAVQAMGRNMHSRKPGSTRQSGFLESIELIDFMCHRNFRMNFSPLINFIYGNNGSGKSAILTAITVALGGRANVTQRGTSFESLIREGATCAKVKIKLNNQGDNPYQPDLYGEHITVERTFRREGASTYVIHACNGRVIATRKDEMNAICDHFAIQVDNPLVVLTQEVAKRFLASSNSKDLYAFFMKATQLEQLSIDYAFAIEKFNACKSSLEHTKNCLQPIRESIRLCEKRLADLEQVKVAHQNIQLLRGELTWAYVEEREKNFKKIHDALERKRSELADLKERLEDARTNHCKIEGQIKEMESSISTEQNRLSPLNQSLATLKNEAKKIEHFINDLNLDATTINKEFGELRSTLEDLNSRIEQEANRRGGHRQEKLRTRAAEIENEIQELNRLIFDERETETTTTAKLADLQERLAEISRQRDGVSRDNENAKRMLANMERSKGDKVKAFGERMPDLLADIKRNKGTFARLPILVGLHIKIKDPRWTLPVEASIGPNVESFIVDNYNDKTTLAKLLQKYSLSNPITVLRFDGEIDTSGGTPDRKFLTALDVLEVDNPVVRKLLIIFGSLEKEVLIEDEREAKNAASSRSRNVGNIYTPKLRMTAGHRSLSVSHLYVNNRLPRLFENFEEQTRQHQQKIRDLTHKWEVINADYSKAMIQAKDLQKGADQARENAIKLDGKLRGVKEESRAIQVELRGQDSVERSVFEEERVGIEARMEALTAQFQASDEQKKELSTQKADIWQKIKALEKEANEICTVQEETVEQISNNVRVRKNIERDMSRFAQLIESELGDIVKQEMVASEAELEANNMAEGASRICARVHVTRTIKELDNELAAQEDCLKNSEIAQINPVKVKQTLDSKRLQLRESEKSIIGHESLIKTFSTAMEQRLRDWEDFRRSVAKHCTSSFIFMLEARGFQGSLEFRHHDAELCINVLPQILQENTKPQQESEPRGQKRRKTTIIQDETESRDIRQLSGGEKSYSTACFLFSLWHCMGCPIRCLDEFDVYMDPVNRNYILELLISSARTSRTQFILITPNKIPDTYLTAPDVRVCRLTDPERTQTTLK